MVQLSLIPTTRLMLSEHLDRLGRIWSDGGMAVGAAHSATARRFRVWSNRPLDESEARRVEAYFNAVMRKHVMRSSDPGCQRARRRLVAASIEADLTEAGWRPDAARREALRTAGFGAVGGAA